MIPILPEKENNSREFLRWLAEKQISTSEAAVPA
jgi:hypothetical protein